MRRILLASFLVSCMAVLAQNTTAPSDSSSLALPDWQQALRSWMMVEDVEDEYNEATFELLADLAEDKLNLNQATREQLEQFPFLSAQQIEGIVEYLDRYKPLRTLSELQMVTALDRDTRLLLGYFVYAGELQVPQVSLASQLSRMLREGHHSIMATARIPFYERKGDRNGYLGYRYRHDFRYQFSYKDRLKFGLTGAQDAGEPFFANKNRLGYDFYSYYLQLRRMGRLEELNLGMYRVQLGMGLVMNTGFYLGKLTMLQSLGRATHVLTAHASRSSANYLHGAAATLRLSNRWKTTVFASYRPLDATLNDDGTARTIVTDGYHRTPAELSKKNNTHLTDLGLRLSWKGPFSLNFNAVYIHFDRPLHPLGRSTATSSQLYRLYAQSGSSFLNASLDYGYTNARFSFSGETALNQDAAFATIHSFSYRLTDEWSLMALYRYYGLRYTAFHARSFSEGSGVQNEHGLYAGASWRPSRNSLFQTYVDYAHFRGPRYQVSGPSDALDAMILARTLLYNIATVEARYRFHLRQRDNATKTYLQNRYEHRARLRVSFPLSAAASAGSSAGLSLSLATQADGTLINSRAGRSRGLMLSQQVQCQYSWIRFYAGVGWFHTDDYDSRLFQYEPSVRYDFSFPAYYGHGIRYAATVRAALGRLTMMAKLGVTDYFDRSTISSGLQQIDASSQTDLLLQFRYQF